MSPSGLLSFPFTKAPQHPSADIYHSKKNGVCGFHSDQQAMSETTRFETPQQKIAHLGCVYCPPKQDRRGERSVSFFCRLAGGQAARGRQRDGEERAGALSQGHQLRCHSVRSISARRVAFKQILGCCSQAGWRSGDGYTCTYGGTKLTGTSHPRQQMLLSMLIWQGRETASERWGPQSATGGLESRPQLHSETR